MEEIRIADRRIGAGLPCFLIAEAGVNHNGDLHLAEALIDAAAKAGADAVKFQTFRAEEVVTSMGEKAGYQLRLTSSEESQLEMLRKLELDEAEHRHLRDACRDRGIHFLSTAFDHGSVDLLDDLGVAAHKIPSGEITNIPYIKHVAAKGKPLIVSTGMSWLGDVEAALAAISEVGNNQVVLLHCTTSYPAAPERVNLRAMGTLQTAFGRLVGYSDHTQNFEIAFAAVALGACVLEKHLTLDRGLPGPDQQSSLEPQELQAMVAGIRKVEQALGDGSKRPVDDEEQTAAVVRRSLVAARDLSRGTILTNEMISIKRPGNGLPPAMLPFIAGRRLCEDVHRDTLLSLKMLE